jgi:mRNA-degrading endonuclease RelE of RelBE toxin-antitoxin system
VTYKVQLSKQIQRQIGRLPGNVRNQAKERILALRSQPRPLDAKELSGHPGFYRIWLGRDFRLVWHCDDEAKLIDIYYVGPKTDDLYEQLGLDRP